MVVFNEDLLKMLKIFDYYTTKGLLDVTHVTLPGDGYINNPDVQYDYLLNAKLK